MIPPSRPPHHLLLPALAVVLWLGACGEGADPGPPLITVIQRQQVRDEIEAAEEVERLAIQQTRHEVRLEIRVRPGIELLRARTLAHEAIKLTKEVSPDKDPGFTMGSGIYDYEVVVVTTEDPPQRIVRGTKIRRGSIINW